MGINVFIRKRTRGSAMVEPYYGEIAGEGYAVEPRLDCDTIVFIRLLGGRIVECYKTEIRDDKVYL